MTSIVVPNLRLRIDYLVSRGYSELQCSCENIADGGQRLELIEEEEFRGNSVYGVSTYTDMEQDHIKLIRRNDKALANDLSTSIDAVREELKEERIINIHKWRDIKEKKDPLKQAEKLLDLIVKCDCNAFDALYKACLNETLWTACDILKEHNAPHEPPEEDSDPEEDADFVIPEDGPWPPDSYISDITDISLNVLRADNRILFDKHIGNTNFYQMTKIKRGKPFILYDKHLPLAMDRRGLERLFSGLKFENLKAIKVEDKEALDALSFGFNGDCFVLFTMATDRDDFFSDNGGNGLKWVTDKLKNESALAGIPKLIFHLSPEAAKNNGPIRDMEGEKKKTGPIPDFTETPKPLGDIVGKSTIKQKTEPQQNHQEEDKLTGDRVDGPLEPQQNHQEEEKLTGDRVDCPLSLSEDPKDSDILFIRATNHGSEVIKVAENQEITRFIHLIIDIFSKNASKMDCNDLLRLVNLRTGQAIVKCKGTLKKKLCFFPGFASVPSPL